MSEVAMSLDHLTYVRYEGCPSFTEFHGSRLMISRGQARGCKPRKFGMTILVHSGTVYGLSVSIYDKVYIPYRAAGRD